MEKIPDYEKQHAELNALKDCLHDLTWQLEDAKEQYNYRIKKIARGWYFGRCFQYHEREVFCQTL